MTLSIPPDNKKTESELNYEIFQTEWDYKNTVLVFRSSWEDLKKETSLLGVLIEESRTLKEFIEKLWYNYKKSNPYFLECLKHAMEFHQKYCGGVKGEMYNALWYVEILISRNIKRTYRQIEFVEKKIQNIEKQVSMSVSGQIVFTLNENKQIKEDLKIEIQKWLDLSRYAKFNGQNWYNQHDEIISNPYLFLDKVYSSWFDRELERMYIKLDNFKKTLLQIDDVIIESKLKERDVTNPNDTYYRIKLNYSLQQQIKIIELMYELLHPQLILCSSLDFKNHFENKDLPNKIQWLGTEPQIKHFIKYFMDKKIIINTNINKIISANFINKKGKEFKESQLSVATSKSFFDDLELIPEITNSIQKLVLTFN